MKEVRKKKKKFGEFWWNWEDEEWDGEFEEIKENLKKIDEGFVVKGRKVVNLGEIGVKRGGLKKLGEMLMEVLEREGVKEREELSIMKKKNRSHGQKIVTTAWTVSPRAARGVLCLGAFWKFFDLFFQKLHHESWW